VTSYTLTQDNLLPSQGWGALVLCKDGRMVAWATGFGPDVNMPASPPPFPFHAELQVGRVTADSLAVLGRDGSGETPAWSRYFLGDFSGARGLAARTASRRSLMSLSFDSGSNSTVSRPAARAGTPWVAPASGG
jgi:hypothetical protein